MTSEESGDNKHERLQRLARERVSRLIAGNDVSPHSTSVPKSKTFPGTIDPSKQIEVAAENGAPTLVEQIEYDYRTALYAIDKLSEDLIHDGKEMRAIVLIQDSISRISNDYDILQQLYNIVFVNFHILQRFGSKRINNLEYELKETYPILSQ